MTSRTDDNVGKHEEARKSEAQKKLIVAATTETPKIRRSDPPSDVKKSDDFDWADHLSAAGCCSATVDESAFGHVVQSHRTLAEYTVAQGTIVRVMPSDSTDANAYSFGRVDVLCGGCCRLWGVDLRAHDKNKPNHGDACGPTVAYKDSTFCLDSAWTIADVDQLTLLEESEFDSLPSLVRAQLSQREHPGQALYSADEDSCSSADTSDSVLLQFWDAKKFFADDGREKSNRDNKTETNSDASIQHRPHSLVSLCRRPIDCIDEGQLLEMQLASDPRLVEVVRVDRNAGGYLTLRRMLPADTDDGKLILQPSPEISDHLFWLHERLHAAGWCGSEHRPALAYRYRGGERVKRALASTAHPTVPAWLFQLPQTRRSPAKHRFEVGMRLEMVDPRNQVDFIPAAVVESLNAHYVVVEADTLKSAADAQQQSTGGTSVGSERTTLIRVENGVQTAGPPMPGGGQVQSSAPQSDSRRVVHSASPFIYHVFWCSRNGIRVKPPAGFGDRGDFTWQAYRSLTGLTCGSDTPAYALDGVNDKRDLSAFVSGRRLEVVDPTDRSRLLPATVTRQTKNLLWVRFDHSSAAAHSILYDSRSLDLFPCGFARSHGLPLLPPYVPSAALLTGDDESRLKHYLPAPTNIFTPSPQSYMPADWLGKEWLPPIYVNFSCVAGPFLNPQRLSKLPQVIGPGPLPLVVQCITNGLIASAQRPSVLLELWQPDKSAGCALSLPVKARYKGRRYRGGVLGCNSRQQLCGWLHHLLSLIDACPMLVSPRRVPQPCACPAQCHVRLAPLEFMAAGQHPCTGGVQSRSTRSNKRHRQQQQHQQRLQPQVQGVSQPPPAVRRRKRPIGLGPKLSPTHDGSVCRPVTRGIKLPKLSPSTHAMMLTSPMSASQQAATRLKRRMHMQQQQQIGASGERLMRHGMRSPDHQPQHLQPTGGGGGGRHHHHAGPSGQQPSQPKPTRAVDGKPLGIAVPQLQANVQRPIIAVPHSQALQARDVYTLATDGTNVTRYPVPPVQSNPNDWTPVQLAAWLRRTDLVAHNVVTNLVQEDVDGQAFLLLTLRDCMEYLGMKLGPALKICSLIQELKIAFLSNYSSGQLPTTSGQQPPPPPPVVANTADPLPKTTVPRQLFSRP